jgi:glutamate synthase (NADPH/NADH) small chain
MDYVYGRKIDVFRAAKPVGKKVAVLGAGPAGLSCAGQLAKLGVSVTLYEKRELPGGLSTYGIIVLREPVEVALAEVAMIQRLGAKVEAGKEVGVDPSVADLQKNFDAVFIGMGLGNSPELGIPGEDYILDGLEYIEQSKLQPTQLHVGRDVIVIGAGNTAIDCATVARRLGAERVTMLYRRTEKEMTAYPHEYAFIKLEGVTVSFLWQPVKVHHENGVIKSLECVRVALGEPDASGRAAPREIPGSNVLLPADQIVKAIGQNKLSLAGRLDLKTERGFISVDSNFETSSPGMFAGGDCIRARGSASTVMAVQDGKLAARSIYQRLMNHG